MTLSCSLPTAAAEPPPSFGDMTDSELILTCPRHPQVTTPLMRTDVMPGARYWCSGCGFRTNDISEALQAPKSDALTEFQAKEVVRAHAFLQALAYLLDVEADPSHADAQLHQNHLATVRNWKYTRY